MIRKIKYGVLVALVKILQQCPEPAVLAILSGVARSILMKKTRRRAENNIRRSDLGLASEKEIQNLAQKSVQHSLCESGMDALFFHKRVQQVVRIPPTNREKTFAKTVSDLQKQGDSPILVSNHISGWFLLFARAWCLGVVTFPLFQKQKSPALEHMLQRTVTPYSVMLSPIQNVASQRLAYRVFAGNDIVSFAIDQYAHSGIPGRFFGREGVRVPALPFRLACQFSRPVIPLRALRNTGAKQKPMTLDFSDPIWPDKKARKPEQVLAQQVLDIAETWIRPSPERWIWMHRFWRGESDRTEQEPC